jgi:prostaglandin-endoperoxide synthase 2
VLRAGHSSERMHSSSPCCTISLVQTPALTQSIPSTQIQSSIGSDYREYVHLPPPRKFEDISTDQRVVELLRAAYNNKLENVEFYVGLFAEDPVRNSPLLPLILRMVAVDAFSQALTNPLLSKSVFNSKTFSPLGWEVIANTGSLRDILDRNTPEGVGKARIGMTLPNWRPS